MKNHEHYSSGEKINTLRDSEELIKFGKESLPRYTLEYWNDACETMEPKRINGLADALVAIKDGDSDEAVKMLKRDWLEDGLVLGSVATYLPEGVDVVRQIHMDVYGEDRSKENSAFLDQMEKWHDEQKKKLAREVGGVAIAKNTESYHGPTTREKFMERVHDTFGPEEARMLAYGMRSDRIDTNGHVHSVWDTYDSACRFLGETDEPDYIPHLDEWTKLAYRSDLEQYVDLYSDAIQHYKKSGKNQEAQKAFGVLLDQTIARLKEPDIEPLERGEKIPVTMWMQSGGLFVHCEDIQTAFYDYRGKPDYGDIDARLYMCPRTDNMMEFINEFRNRCDDNKLRYYFKYSTTPERNDRFIVYSNYDRINDHIDILNEMKKERPELFEDMDDTRKNPFWGKIDGAPEGVYFGQEPTQYPRDFEKTNRDFGQDHLDPDEMFGYGFGGSSNIYSYGSLLGNVFTIAFKKWARDVYGKNEFERDRLHFDSPSDISWENAERLEQIFREELDKADIDPNNMCFDKYPDTPEGPYKRSYYNK